MTTAYEALQALAEERLNDLDTSAPAKARSASLVPASQLGHLAWSRGLDYWSESWSESTKRELTRTTPRNLRQRGTRAAIDLALQAFAADLVVEEWWEQTPLGAPGTANAIVTIGSDLGGDVAAQNEVLRLLEREGRKSIHWDLVLGPAAYDQIAPASYLRVTTLVQVVGEQISGGGGPGQ